MTVPMLAFVMAMPGVAVMQMTGVRVGVKM
jgi:hypothetical protein